MEIHKQCNKVNYVIWQSRILTEQIKSHILQKERGITQVYYFKKKFINLQRIMEVIVVYRVVMK